jgi:hypothetical protein
VDKINIPFGESPLKKMFEKKVSEEVVCGVPTATTSAGSGGTRSCWLERGGYNRSSASGTKADDPESRELAF